MAVQSVESCRDNCWPVVTKNLKRTKSEEHCETSDKVIMYTKQRYFHCFTAMLGRGKNSCILIECKFKNCDNCLPGYLNLVNGFSIVHDS